MRCANRNYRERGFNNFPILQLNNIEIVTFLQFHILTIKLMNNSAFTHFYNLTFLTLKHFNNLL